MQHTGYKFKLEHPYDVRKAESMRIIHKYPTKIPIILEEVGSRKYHKYLIRDHMTVGELLYSIRLNIGIKSSDAVYIYVNNTYIPTNNEILKNIYNTNKDDDGYLYIMIAKENTFG